MPDEETPQPGEPEETSEQPEADAAEASADAPSPSESDPDANADAIPADGDDDAIPADEPGTAAEQLAQDALKAAQEAVSSLSDATALSDEGVGADASGATPFAPPAITEAQQVPGAEGLDLLSDVNLHVRIELGRTRMYVEDVLKLSNGAVVELDKLAGDPVDVYVNDRHVARGEVLILNDNFCVRINEIISARHFEVATS